MNKFAQLFVFVNRVFGFFTLLGGACILVISILWSIRYGLGKVVWELAAFGVVFIVIGVLYLKAPLFRSAGSHDEK